MEEIAKYPDVGEIFARKARGRRERAALTFAEKLAILDRMREDVRPFREALEAERGKLAMPRPG